MKRFRGIHCTLPKTVIIPLAELYMVYTRTKGEAPEVLHLPNLCGGPGSVEVSVQILHCRDSSILGQYVEFCQVADEQRTIHRLTKTAIQETMRICQERALLVPFLAARRNRRSLASWKCLSAKRKRMGDSQEGDRRGCEAKGHRTLCWTIFLVDMLLFMAYNKNRGSNISRAAARKSCARHGRG